MSEPGELRARNEELLLLQQGISANSVLGVDAEGIPLVCGTTTGTQAVTKLSQQKQEEATVLPTGTRGWETIPNVIRDDGVDSFHLEVNVNGPVAAVTLDSVSALLTTSGPASLRLRDDGQGGDRVSGDFIYTSDPIRYNTAFPLPAFYMDDPSSPAGLYSATVGRVNIEALDGTITHYLTDPAVGILGSGIPAASMVALSPNIQVSSHLINIRTSTQETQRLLRDLGGNPRNITNPIYQVLPDEFDFFLFFSTNKIELVPATSTVNFTAGLHYHVQTNYTGTGLNLFNDSASYGSSGRLLAVNALDAYSRGITSQNATHELLHQWGAYISPSFGLSDGVHYQPKSSVGSLLGGFQWIDNGNGSFMRNCAEGRNAAHHASELDKYMMGLTDGTQVGHPTSCDWHGECRVWTHY